MKRIDLVTYSTFIIISVQGLVPETASIEVNKAPLMDSERGNSTAGINTTCTQLNRIPQVNRSCRCSGTGSQIEPLALECKNRGMPELHLAFQHIPKGTHLDRLLLKSNVIPIIATGFFNGIQSRYVSMRSSRLHEFEAGAPFADLAPALKSLNLGRNDIQELSPNIFSGLKNLEYLDLSENKIQEIVGNTFERIQGGKMELLQLSRNKIRIIESGCFKPLAHLTHLFLWENHLTYLPQGVFDGLNNLEYLELSENRLNKIGSNVFADLPKLNYLSLIENRLKQVDVNGLRNLRTLYVSHNEITQGKMTGLVKLKRLRLNKNQIESLEKLNLMMKNVEELYLDRNRIQNLTILGDFPKLKFLSFDNNPIRSIKVSGHLLSLQYLYMPHHRLVSIPSGALDQLPADVEVIP